VNKGPVWELLVVEYEPAEATKSVPVTNQKLFRMFTPDPPMFWGKT